MARLFEEEKKDPDNARRVNFVFLAYPFTPPIPQEHYNAVVKELQKGRPLATLVFPG